MRRLAVLVSAVVLSTLVQGRADAQPPTYRRSNRV
ncbi:Uncharacterised protein [Streptomyces griseus]|nr:Uncharacterised protein [Streptomyces griseus]